MGARTIPAVGGRLVAAICLIVGLLPASSIHAQAADGRAPVDHVDPMIGTLGSGFVFPGPAAPYGMVQLSPDTEGYFAYTGYLYSDNFIRGFSHVHVQGMGVPSSGNVPFMPTVGPILSTDAKRYQSRFSHATEKASAGYYSVLLENYGITAELTAGVRTGMHRYTFPASSQANVILDIGRQIPGGPTDDVQRTPGYYTASIRVVDERTVIGTANPYLEGPQHYPVHFVARFNRPFASFGTWSGRGAPMQQGVASVEAKGAGAAVTFDATRDPTVLVKVGISFVSQANALANLDHELPGNDFDFDALRARTRAAWNDALGTIDVDGGTVADKTAFYTALYHAQQHPNVFSDANGDYLGHDGSVHRIGAPGDPMPADSTYYANYSLWDTYRGQVQLLALIQPQRFSDMLRSLLAIKTWGGRLPRWSLMNAYPDFMPGEPVLQVIADGYCRGLVPPDAERGLYEAARTLALEQRRDPSYLTHGYVPHDINGGGASATLEHALGDFALALVADGLGETQDRDRLLELAANYRNIFDPETRFVRPRLSDGSWMTPYLPELPDGFVEGTGWQYTWLVPHDVRGLFDLMGAAPRGADRFVTDRLDTFFSTALASAIPFITPEVQQKITLFGITYLGNQYAPSNEHDLHAPYLYAWTGEAFKNQALARAYQTLYRPVPDGLPGNDDLGTMSSWYVWSALGFYPAIAGAPVYVIGSPVFDEARIVPVGKRDPLVVRAPGASLMNKYIQSASLGGDPLERAWFTQEELEEDGELIFSMGSSANRDWAAGRENAPPSMSSSPLSAFGCAPEGASEEDRDPE